ncbi:hypothetical protein LI291_10855 [Intestinibacillus massiliensis]|nr:hypothetical protein [Intestinibacillus massiliensis]
MKIVATRPDNRCIGSKIPATNIAVQPIAVSFSFADFKCKSFRDERFNNCFKHFGDYGKFIAMFIAKLSNFSSMTVQELKLGGKATRCHKVENKNRELLEDILKSTGMKEEKIEQIEEFYQLTISTSNGRFMGYFIGNVFYVVLIDPHHLLYPDLKKSMNQDLCNPYDPWKEFLDNY